MRYANDGRKLKLRPCAECPLFITVAGASKREDAVGVVAIKLLLPSIVSMQTRHTHSTNTSAGKVSDSQHWAKYLIPVAFFPGEAGKDI